MDRSPFLQALAGGSLLGDGAMGTELHARGLGYELCYEELCVSRPEVIAAIHDAYVEAGAAVLETNTFGANRVRLARHGLEAAVPALQRAAVALARRSAGGRAFVVGAMGPTGLAVGELEARSPAALRDVFREQAEALAAEGVDALFLETFQSPSEAIRAAEGARLGAPGVPIVAHLAIVDDRASSGGVALASMAARLADAGVSALGVNCGTDLASMLAAVEQLLPLGVPISVLPSAGLPALHGGALVHPLTPALFASGAARLFARGASLVGGCCGTTPEHVRAARALLSLSREPAS